MSFASPPYEVLKCNFHAHFSWHNQLMRRRPSGLATVQGFHDAGFDAIVLTEHGYESNLGLEKETQDAAAERFGDKMLVGIGCELSFDDDADGRFGGGDCGALFLQEDVDCLSAPGYKPQPLAWVIEKVHEQDGLAIINHHLCSHARHPIGDGLWKWRKEFAIDGWEIFNGCSAFGGDAALAWSYPDEAVEEGHIALSAADSHTPFQATCSCASCTYVFAKERSLKGLKEALVDRRTVAFAGGFLYGRPEWVKRFKAWRRQEPAEADGLLCADLMGPQASGSACAAALGKLAETYARADLSRDAYRRELMALSDLTWCSEHALPLKRAFRKTLVALSRHRLELDEQEMLDWYKRSYQEGIEALSANPKDAQAAHKAGQAGAFFPEIICSAEEARAHLEQALNLDPELHVARAGLVNFLAKRSPTEALEHCEKGLASPNPSPYLAALKRHLVRGLERDHGTRR